MPLWNFIQIIETNNLYWLLKPQCTDLPKDAPEIWEGIFLEYLELTGDAQFRYMIELTEKIESLRLKITAVESSLLLLENYKSKPIIEALLEMGYKVEDMKGWDDYFESLRTIQKRLGNSMMELRIKQKEFENLKKNYGKSKNDGNFFTKVLNRLSKHQGYRVAPLTTTVAEFALMLNDYINTQWQQVKE
jgi:hypothetical protein